CGCSVEGARSAGTPWAPEQAGAQAANFVGSMTGGPVHGQVRMSGGCAGWSQPMLHAPVGAVGSDEVGSKQGAQASLAPQTSLGRSAACSAICGMQVDMHRPSAPATDLQLFGTVSPPAAMIGSGARTPAEQAASSACSVGGTRSAGTQWAPPQAGLHEGRWAGSTTGGPVHGQVRTTGGLAGWSQARLQAPDGVVGCDEVGS